MDTKTSWIKCPVCGVPDVLCDTDAEGLKLIHCANHACASNGGTNASALTTPDAPVGVVYHASDCATNNAPAMEPGPCDCNAALAQVELERISTPSSDAAPGEDADV